MIGQSAPIGEPNRFVEHITSLARRVRELELAAASGCGWIQAGTFTGTTDSSGDVTITYPTAFPGTPTPVATRRIGAGATTTRTLQVIFGSETTTGFTVRCFAAGTAQASTEVIVHWHAVMP